MTTVSELNLVTLFQHEWTVFYNLVWKHIHHLDFLSDRSNDVESIGMESYSSGLFRGWASSCDLESIFLVVPDIDDFLWTCDNERLSKANVHSSDLLPVVWTVHVSRDSMFPLSIQIYLSPQQLVLAISVEDSVLTVIKSNALNVLRFDCWRQCNCFTEVILALLWPNQRLGLREDIRNVFIILRGKRPDVPILSADHETMRVSKYTVNLISPWWLWQVEQKFSRMVD